MLVNDLVKGQRITTTYGMEGTVVSKAKGIRIMVKVEVPGQGYDIGDIYVWQVAVAKDEKGIWRATHLTERQTKQQEKVRKQAGEYAYMLD